jgi:hypothetical protein
VRLRQLREILTADNCGPLAYFTTFVIVSFVFLHAHLVLVLIISHYSISIGVPTFTRTVVHFGASRFFNPCGGVTNSLLT